jgi:Uma2 family endonuclease
MGSALELLVTPVRISPAARLSDEEFLAFCRAGEPYRFEEDEHGKIIMMTPAGAKGANLEGYLFRELDAWVESSGRGFAVNSNAGFRLPDTSLRLPDAGWISPEKWNSLSADEQEKFPHFCPEFVIELRSPGDRVAGIEKKMGKWIRNGAQLAWLIDRKRKLAVIYRSNREPQTLVQPDFLEGEGPVAGFRLKMERFWA